MSRGFQARYAGRCGSCAENFAEGDYVRYDEDDVLIGQACCPPGGGGDDPLSPLSPRRDTIIQTMPRNRTIKDRCPRCFQIPASNNVCGCD